MEHNGFDCDCTVDPHRGIRITPQMRISGLSRNAMAIVAIGAAFAVMQSPVSGDEPQPRTAPLVWDDVPLNIDSGFVQHDGIGAGVQAAFSELIDARDAAWIRLEFGNVHLPGSIREGNHAYLRITSLADGAHQILDATSIQQWQYTSAYFNGSAVEVELFVHPDTPPSRVQITGYQHGLVDDDAGLSLCDGTDTRQLTTAAPDARLRPVGCTGWLISDQCFVTAGHCSGGSLQIAEFNVPMSQADGTLVFSHPNDQYAVDPASRQQGNAGCGNDWAYFGTFTNSNTGLTPFQAQGAMYTMAAAVPAPSNQTIRVRGYGVTVGFPLPNSWNQVLKISFGPYVQQDGTLLQYRVDASPGDSGSALFNTQTGTVIGIVTCTGCSDNWPDFIGNRGTAITHPGLQNALANPQGVCAATGPSCPPSDESCYETGGPGCEDVDCCNTICAQDPFCCNNSWDSICVNQAINQCFGCGHPNAGSCCEANGSPYCENFECCKAVCAFDPFCCNNTWDSICADGAATVPACNCGPEPNNCPPDLNGDGVVDGGDLLQLLASWGPCAGCPADLNGDNVVDGGDLLQLLAAWGPCPEKVCEVGFICGGEVPWCNEPEFCACLHTFNGSIECLYAGVGCGQTCSSGSCPAGQICVVDTCCNGGAPTCIEEVPCEPADPLCDGGFVCGEEVNNCEGFEGTTCYCWNGYGGGFVCGDGNVFCDEVPTCPNGSCPPGYVCAVDTCCNEPVCLPACDQVQNECSTPGTCGSYTQCGTGSPFDCLCWEIDGNPDVGQCFQDFFCSDAFPCPAEGCPPGYACVTDSCCGAAFCAPIVKCDGSLDAGTPPDKTGFTGSGAFVVGADAFNNQPADRPRHASVTQTGPTSEPASQPSVKSEPRRSGPSGVRPGGEMKN
jgi:V8-like Glu-specific endopeptidase